MDQTNITVGVVIVAFIIFITVKGELPTYLGFLLGTGTGAVAPAQQQSNNGSGIGQAVSAIAPLAMAAFA